MKLHIWEKGLHILLLLIILLPAKSLLYAQTAEEQSPSVKQEKTAAPGLGDIIPLASELNSRFRILESKFTGLLDISAAESQYAAIESGLEQLSNQLEQLKESEDYKYNRLVALRGTIKQKNELLKETGIPIIQAIRQIESWKTEWLREKGYWDDWQTTLLEDKEYEQLRPVFVKADKTIGTALDRIISQLSEILSLQHKAGDIQAQLDTLGFELGSLIARERRSAMLYESPPMLSAKFFSQFNKNELWYATAKGTKDALWIDANYFSRLGWILLVELFVVTFFTFAIFRNKSKLLDTEHWRFLAMRPFAAVLFLTFMLSVFIYEYFDAPTLFKLINIVVAGISFSRLAESLLQESWKRQFVYSIVAILIAARLLIFFNFPLPVFRLYIVIVALAGLVFLWRWSGESSRHKEPFFYTLYLRLSVLFLAVIIFAEFWGNSSLASYLFISLIRTTATLLAIMLFMYIVQGGVKWLFSTSPLRRATGLQSDDTENIVRRVARFLNVVISVLVLFPAILLIWNVYDTLGEATKGLLAFGFKVGTLYISVSLVLAAAGIIYGSFLVSWILQKMLMDEVLYSQRIEKGVRVSMARLIHYAVMLVGFLLAISALGFEVTKITILLSALGVGIGFGLQGVVNNFISGLILLFERPVRVDDIIELGGNWATIKKIGLRATTVQTYDQADVIIPNADLVSNQVTNWTLSNRQARLIIPLGVAYGSDVPLVIETLLACAKENTGVVQMRPAQVLFQNFGESSLDFELRVWVLDADNRLKVGSDLRQEIDKRFREAGIEISFPQRDLHLRSVDDSVSLPSTETSG